MATESDLWEEAHRRANVYAPRPRHSPIEAGLSGAAIVAVVLILFTALSGLDLEQHSIALAGTACAGFVCPFLWFRSAENKHYGASRKEYDALRREQLRKGAEA